MSPIVNHSYNSCLLVSDDNFDETMSMNFSEAEAVLYLRAVTRVALPVDPRKERISKESRS